MVDIRDTKLCIDIDNIQIFSYAEDYDTGLCDVKVSFKRARPGLWSYYVHYAIQKCPTLEFAEVLIWSNLILFWETIKDDSIQIYSKLYHYAIVRSSQRSEGL